MANKVFSHRDGILRIYDATGTPNYVVAKFIETDFSCPMNADRGEEELMLNQEKADTNIHWMKKSDKPIFMPVDFSFSGLIYDTHTALLLWPALCNPDNASTWTVGAATTYVSVSAPGSRTNMEGTSVTCPLPVDVDKFFINIEYLLDGDSADMGRQLKACHIAAKDIDLDFGIPGKFKVKGKCYGAMAKITSFTAGTETTS